MKYTSLIITLCFLPLLALEARESKEYDNDVNYDESKIPHYDLPQLLITPDGKKITTAEEWQQIRRPQILSLFSNLIYGRVPAPSIPIKVEFEAVNTDPVHEGKGNPEGHRH